MSTITTAAKIAIHFIRPFRSYLDGYALVKDRRPILEQNLKERMDTLLDEFKFFYPDATADQLTYKSEFFKEISKLVLDRYEKSYDAILPKMIDSLTTSIENLLKNNYTEDELKELEVLLANPVMKKLLSDATIFRLLKDCELQMDYEIQLQMFNTMMGNGNGEKLQQIISELKNKYDKNADNRGYDQFYEDDEDDTWGTNK